MQMRILRRVLARVPNAVDIVAYGHMGVCQRSMSPGTRLHAGLDFASFGADLGAAQAAALQFYEAQGAADANRRAVQAAISVGTLLNGAGRSLVHLTVNALYIKCCLCMGCPLLCPQVSASSLQQRKPPEACMKSVRPLLVCMTCRARCVLTARSFRKRSDAGLLSTWGFRFLNSARPEEPLTPECRGVRVRGGADAGAADVCDRPSAGDLAPGKAPPRQARPRGALRAVHLRCAHAHLHLSFRRPSGSSLQAFFMGSVILGW